MKFLILILFGFAWAIGGEKYFGKWKRSLLVYIPIVLFSLNLNFFWKYYIIQFLLGLIVYQALFYDMGIKLIWPEKNKTNLLKKIVGYAILFINGGITALQPMYFIYIKDNNIVVWPILALGIFFITISLMSNQWKIEFPVCFKIGEVKIFCPKDCWWLAEFVFGLYLGGCFVRVI